MTSSAVGLPLPLSEPPGDPMSEQPRHIDLASPLKITREIDVLCDEFESALRRGGHVAIVQYLGRVDLSGRMQLITELGLLALDHLRHKAPRIQWASC